MIVMLVILQSLIQSLYWKCDLPSLARVLLEEFLEQYHLPQPYLTYTMWEAYAEHHVKVKKIIKQ